ncbi:MAG: heavy metal translocating P-type ATPase [Desulfomicrobium sp.]|nr:heavy metal translocating P-type ATPase [Pseudomonadota bacterium]MBV1713368.1 heavy metal translocating P-type ATPase [Desulfomicrobium sp.]MBU4570498.1 heavy metal translocating P-type ATPase [Pseudomonadota bacterium]MBU4593855.1 heavy metal translocating P-type ATPase [Pseudomonadota bacterium]MBV1719691.1 heavy metal translocating P-type ATPase [Desulfomicrobium sp.]
MQKITFVIKEMDCSEEVAILKRVLLPIVGQDSRLEFDLLGRKLHVDLSDLLESAENVAQAINATGMKAEPFVDALPSCACCGGTCPTKGSLWERRGRELLCVVSGLLWAGGLALMMTEHGSILAAFKDSAAAPFAAKLLWVLAVLVGVWHVLPKAIRSLRALRPDMNLLMVLAVSGAMVIGEYSEGASVAFLFALANQLEAWSIGRARNAIQALMSLAPDTALVFSPLSPSALETPVQDVPTGSRVLIRPGDRVPLDGVVLSGISAVDQSPITGESMPVTKSVGDVVYAGTINADGALEVETTKLSSESTLARIMRMVEQAQSRRAKAVQWVEKFAAVYTPVMVAVAILFAVVPPVFFGGAWDKWFYEALVILVISCPCALVISTPVSIVAALASAARNGVLVKGGVFLEVPATLNAIALDKTGTLTHGRPSVTEVTAFSGSSESELLGVAAALESRSSHPVGQAIMRHASSMGVPLSHIEDAQARPGLGAQGRIRETTYFIGNPRFLAETGNVARTDELEQAVDRHAQSAGTFVLVWTEGKVLGCLTVEDRVRSQSRDALKELALLGVDTIVMLTGDNAKTAAKIAAEAGVTQYRSDLLPEDKTRVVTELVASGKRVGMVGDGVNDAPALAASHLGIAMGSIGTDVAIETADVALMSDDLSKLPWLIRHSRRTLGTIKANIWFALGVKAVFLLLAIFQMATLWTAILADLGSSLLVIFNGLRLLQIKR